MQSVYLTDIKKAFDFTAIRIFFSVLAILLSLILPSAQAGTDNMVINQPSILEKIIADFKNQKSDNILKNDRIQDSCFGRSPSSTANQNSILNSSWGQGHFCPANDKNFAPNES